MNSNIIRDAKVLILDEPTSGLDGKNMQRILKLMNDYVAQGGTILLLTHDLELINNACTSILNLEKVKGIVK